MQYRPDIDGMRAVAVLGVLFYHAGLGFPGGYVGVDVFFVISGFLITSIILNELRTNRFSMAHFWARRIRRILPAVSFVVLCIVIAGWFLMTPQDYKRLGEQVLTLIVLSANIKFWKENDYFNKASDTNPMLHTWSLSIEEQFYLLLPVVLLLLFKYHREKWIYPLLWITIIASFVGSVYISHTHPKSNFFLLPTRIWELDIGALIAYRMPILSRRSTKLFSLVGLSGIVVPYFMYSEGITFPGISALPPVLGSAMLIIAGAQKNLSPGTDNQSEFVPLISKFLSLKPLVFIGLISYSLYLWHWPFLAFQKYLDLDTSHIWIQILLLISAVFIAWVSWRFIEQPFRKRSNFPKQFHVYVAGAGMTFLLLIPACYLVFSEGAIQRLDESMWNINKEVVERPFRALLQKRKNPSIPISLGQEDGIPKIFIWGDSHTEAVLPGMDRACKDLGISGRAVSLPNCAPVLDWYFEDNRSLKYNHDIFEVVAELHKSSPSLVVMLAARWDQYFGFFESRPAPAGFEEALTNTIRKLREKGIRVVILKQVARFHFSFPDVYMRASFHGASTADMKTSIVKQKLAMKDANRFFDQLEAEGVLVIDPNRALALDNGDIVPVELRDGQWHALWRDNNHLSPYGSMKLSDEFKKMLEAVVPKE